MITKKRTPPEKGANSYNKFHTCSFRIHKQNCFSALTELKYGVVHNSNNFSPTNSSSKQKKIDAKIFQYLKVHVEGV